MFGVFDNISIEGIQAVVPSKTVNNMDFAEQIGERRCKKQLRLTGIEQRHLCKHNQKSADLVYGAAHELMQNLDWEPESIDVLVFATQSPMFFIPSTAFFLQKRLGLSKDCTVFDVNLGCSSSTVGIQIVSSLLQAVPEGRGRGLLLVGDTAYPPSKSKEMTPDELADTLLFGAAGSAVALQRTPAPLSPLYFNNKSDGSRYQTIFRAPGRKERFRMDGEGVFQFAINEVAADIVDFRKRIGITDADVDYYSFHQAQELLLTMLDDACGIAPGKSLRSLGQYGNTNGSSPLVTLCVNDQTLKQKAEANLLLCGFGVGLSWCSAYAAVRTDRIYPIRCCDAVYDWKKLDTGEGK